jgi:hypothetical protein
MEDKPKRINKRGQQSSMLKLLGAVLLILLFSVGMVNFGFNLSNDNNSSHAIRTDESLLELNDTFTQQIDNSSGSFNASADGFFGSVPVLKDIEATITAIFGVIPAFISTVTGTFVLIFGFIRTQLGIPPIVLQMASAFILVMVILLAWRVYKAGQ